METVVELFDPLDAFAFEDGRVYRRRRDLKRLLPGLYYKHRLDCRTFQEVHGCELGAQICVSVIRTLKNRRDCADSVTARAIRSAIADETRFLRFLINRFCVANGKRDEETRDMSERHSPEVMRRVIAGMQENW